jgi:hypothetical protein
MNKSFRKGSGAHFYNKPFGFDKFGDIVELYGLIEKGNILRNFKTYDIINNIWYSPLNGKKIIKGGTTKEIIKNIIIGVFIAFIILLTIIAIITICINYVFKNSLFNLTYIKLHPESGFV